MKPNKFLDSTFLQIAVILSGTLTIMALIFFLGVLVGQGRAKFSSEWAQFYPENLINSSGLSGQIIKINERDGAEPEIIILCSDGTERSILLTKKTIIRIQRQSLKAGDLRTYDYVIVVGYPNTSGQIQADLIRIMPQPI